VFVHKRQFNLENNTYVGLRGDSANTHKYLERKKTWKISKYRNKSIIIDG